MLASDSRAGPFIKVCHFKLLQMLLLSLVYGGSGKHKRVMHLSAKSGIHNIGCRQLHGEEGAS